MHIEGVCEGDKETNVYNSFNNIFVNLQHVQRRMVEFYSMTFEECQGILKFIIKLDECEIIKEKKIEQVTITLINRALDPSITTRDSKYFSVQSKKHIWWLGAFEASTLGLKVNF